LSCFYACGYAVVVARFRCGFALLPVDTLSSNEAVLGLLPCCFAVLVVDVLLPFRDGFVDNLVVAAVSCDFLSVGYYSVGCCCSSGLSIVAWVSPTSVAAARESPRAGVDFVVLVQSGLIALVV
ncbi:hypothetical protein U1Q18_037728, partial [Sarracenia purpurea var. burkii]